MTKHLTRDLEGLERRLLFLAGEVEEAVLNGRPLPGGTPPGGRLELPDLESENVLVVRMAQRRTDAGQGVNRCVDPSDVQVYVWMSFEPPGNRVTFCRRRSDSQVPRLPGPHCPAEE